MHPHHKHESFSVWPSNPSMFYLIPITVMSQFQPIPQRLRTVRVLPYLFKYTYDLNKQQPIGFPESGFSSFDWTSQLMVFKNPGHFLVLSNVPKREYWPRKTLHPRPLKAETKRNKSNFLGMGLVSNTLLGVGSIFSIPQVLRGCSDCVLVLYVPAVVHVIKYSQSLIYGKNEYTLL